MLELGTIEWFSVGSPHSGTIDASASDDLDYSYVNTWKLQYLANPFLLACYQQQGRIRWQNGIFFAFHYI
jgi:hypothetical protein